MDTTASTNNTDAPKPAKRVYTTHFGQNIKLLRKRKRLSQEDVALHLELSRSTIKNYENSTASPKIENLITFSDFFNISIDTLLRINLGGLREYQLSELDRGFDVYVSSSKLRVLAKSVTKEDKEIIELVPEKAEAGYTSGYADPEYISQLPVFNLPFLPDERKYRAFEISGDSMLPIPNGAHVIGEYVENWYDIKNGEACIVVTQNDGIVFKSVENKIRTDKVLRLSSLNTVYKPYEVDVMEVKEVWRFVSYISGEMPEAFSNLDNVAFTVNKMSRDVEVIRDKIDKAIS
jgi:transcriptional regulator with XRE-family HTH domain